MAKVQLGNRPKNFKHTVTVDMLDGTKGTIECVFKYRTKKEFGELIDGLTEAARAAEKKAEDAAKALGDEAAAPFSLKAFHEKNIESSAEYTMQVLESWNLDVELSRAAIEQLADELPGASSAIANAYRVAITEGRLGN